MSRQGAAQEPAPHGVVPATHQDDERDLVIKVKFGGALKRFNACVNGSHFDHTLAALRSKIASAFKFRPDTEFVLTYTDEDGDVVMLDDDSDLCDAAISQKLNPLRINVELKSCSAGAPQKKQQVSDSRSLMSIALEDQLAQVKSASSGVLAKLSHDLRSKAASSAPSLAELLDKLMAPKSSMQPSSGSADRSSGLSSGREQTTGKLNIKNEAELMEASASKPLDMQNSGSTKALGLKGVLAEAECASGNLSFVDTFSGWTKVDHKGTANAQSKGKSVTSSAVPHVASIGHGAPTVHSTPASDFGEGVRSDLFWPQQLGHSYEPFGPNNGCDLNSPYPPPLVGPYPAHYLGGIRNIKGGSCYPPCTYKHVTSKPDNLSSASLYGPYSEGTSSTASPYRDLSDEHESMAQHTLHRWIQCDGCGVTPIAGSRYKSKIKDDYDLCNACFSQMGNVDEYTLIDRPTYKCIARPSSFKSRKFRDTNQNQMHLRQLNECRFVKDVTVPDGTAMAPSTPFTKIWRMHNSGSSMWPYGTRFIWVGGDQFARHSSVKLGISVAGFPIDQEIDVGVDFVAPAKPGGYISYWRLALPSGQMFGQRVWVFIQVEHPVQTSSNNKTVAINLNLPPEGSSTEWKPFTDMNVQPTGVVGYYSESTSMNVQPTGVVGYYSESTSNNLSGLVLSTVPSVPRAFEPAQVRVPASDLLTSSAGAEKASIPVGGPAPEATPLPKPVGIPSPAPAHAYAPVSVPTTAPVAAAAATPISVSAAPPAAIAPISVPTAAPVAADVAPISETAAPAASIHMPSAAVSAAPPVPLAPSLDAIVAALEDNLLRELEEMGFTEVDLNKKILRRNKYNLEMSIDELHGLEWDVLHEELNELGL